VRYHLSEGMRFAGLRHTEIARDLAALWAAMSSIAESVHGPSPYDTIYVEVVGELAVEF
jgi:hypothetical protein